MVRKTCKINWWYMHFGFDCHLDQDGCVFGNPVSMTVLLGVHEEGDELIVLLEINVPAISYGCCSHRASMIAHNAIKGQTLGEIDKLVVL